MPDIGSSIQHAADVVRQGGIVVYPTEAVYGIGCDFRQQQSVLKLLNLKQRSVEQGLILVASHVQQVLPLIMPQDKSDLARALKTWPGHATWVFPNTSSVPTWVTGTHGAVAVRVSNHPTVKSLCHNLSSALVSTSANVTGQPTPNDCQQIAATWGDEVDYYLDLPLGLAATASTIRLAHGGEVLR